LEIIYTEPDNKPWSSSDNPELVSCLRMMLIEQAEPVIDALYAWSRFSKRALWGQVASSWGAQFTSVLGYLNRHRESLGRARAFFDVPGFIRGMSPAFYPVTHWGKTRIYQRRASCCLYYRLPKTSYCASCPLVSQSERVERNKEWMEKGY
jgi:ferric iron reductase protein FhuF